jgi:2-oxo-4-hydroxy-4-carboxy-5-ureidoimidazoline decarboxylase
MTIKEISSLSCAQFVEAVGWVFEHSPWVAQRAWERRPFTDVDQLHNAMAEVVERATPEEQLALLRAHPDLGTRAKMSAASAGEQSGVGLDSLTSDEYRRLQQSNTAYREKFGFPFLYAVKGSTKYDILQALDQRIDAMPAEEFRKALTQVYRIAGFRLRDTIS